MSRPNDSFIPSVPLNHFWLDKAASFWVRFTVNSSQQIDFPAERKNFFSTKSIMKFLLNVAALIGLIWVVTAEKKPTDMQNNKTIQVNTVLTNDRVLSNYIRCLLEKGACTREGLELKSKLFSITQYFIEAGTFVLDSFPLKKFRHFFNFKRYVLFYTYDTIVDILKLISLVCTIINIRINGFQLPNSNFFTKKSLLSFFCFVQNFFQMLYKQIVRRARQFRSETREKWSPTYVHNVHMTGKPSPINMIHTDCLINA